MTRTYSLVPLEAGDAMHDDRTNDMSAPRGDCDEARAVEGISSSGEWAADRPTRRQLVLAYVMAAVAFGYFVGPFDDGNTASRLSLVMALVEEHRFTVDTAQTSPPWQQFETQDRSYFRGHYYTDKAIGASLVGAAAWTPVHYLLRLVGVPIEPRAFAGLATFLGVSLVCALLGPLVFAFVASLSGTRMATLVMCAILFGTPVFKYSTGCYGHVQAALLYFAAFVLWYNARRRRRLSAVRAFSSGVLLGFMVVTEYPTAVLALVLAVYMLMVLRDLGQLAAWRPYAATGAGAVLALSPLLYYNAHVYGTPFTTGYQHHATAEFAAAHAQGLSGLGLPDPVVIFASTFHPFMGIFWQSPVLLLAIAGWAYAQGPEQRAASWFSLSAITIYLVLLSGYYDWSGGTAYTPRHLIPVYPLFSIPLAVLPRHWRLAALALCVLSIVQHLVAVVASWDSLSELLDVTIVDNHPTRFFVSTIWSLCWVNVRARRLLENPIMRFWPEGGLATLVPLLLVEGVLVAALVRSGSSSRAQGKFEMRHLLALVRTDRRMS